MKKETFESASLRARESGSVVRVLLLVEEKNYWSFDLSVNI